MKHGSKKNMLFGGRNWFFILSSEGLLFALLKFVFCYQA